MFDNRLVFETQGNLPGLVRPDNIRHTHFSRNPKIAEYLKAYKYVKEFGEGIDRLCKELETNGVEIPSFRVNAFILQTPLMAGWSSENEFNRPSTAQVKKMITVLQEDYVGVSEIMRLCEIVRRKTIQDSYITPALADGSIERKFPDQPKRPDQMYRLSKLAIEWKRNVMRPLETGVDYQ